MIEHVKKTYEYFPKQEMEEERTLSAINYTDESQVRLIIYINGIKHTCSETVSHYEYERFKGDYEEVILRRLCRKFNDKFDAKEEGK